MTLSVELDEKEEVLYRFLKDVCFKGEMSNKELINILIKSSIRQIIGEMSYESFINNLVDRNIITHQERKELLCYAKK